MNEENSTGAGPLAGVKILDLGSMIAGPYAVTTLCDQGAEVIKVEPPGLGDVMRYLGATREGVGAIYHNVNRGKRSIAIDLKSGEGLALVLKLAETADVVVQNFRPGVVERLGLDYQSLCAVNPSLIYLSVSGFGERGPYRDKGAYDNIIQAFAGVARSQANQDTGEPVQYYQLFADKLSALTGSQAITAALFARQRGAGGQHIRLSMAKAVAAFLWADVAGTAGFREPGAQPGIAVAKGVPLMEFKDGWGAVAPVTDAQFAGYCRTFGVDGSDPRYSTLAARNANPEEMTELMQQIRENAAATPIAQAIAAMDAEGVPCAQVMELVDLPRHPQMIANNSFTEVDNPQAGAMIEPNNPPEFLGTPSPSLRPAAALGEHTDAIMAELGYGSSEIKHLREAGVIA